MNTFSQPIRSGRTENPLVHLLRVRGATLPRRACSTPSVGLHSYRIVLAPLLNYDTMNINYEEGIDAYLPESQTILARLSGCTNADAVNRVVHEELRESFGPDAVDSGRRFEQVAREIWDRWERSTAAPRTANLQVPRLAAPGLTQ